GVDYEDWFSEDLPPEARKYRPIEQLKAFERQLIRGCNYRLTTSNALASALSEAYDAPKPSVIYNAFPFAERRNVDGLRSDRRNLSVPSMHWFSQTIGPGRGLEQLFDALRYISSPAELHLRGKCSEYTKRWIESLIPLKWRNQVFVHQTVANAELLSRICEHDVGLALEIPYCLNKQLTTSNKMLQ
ncbi:MAG: glycosyl transferase family 1, partial [Acidobacteriota bacterium]|nr:glycosyl transferase family 1 [Acidobacteriota bacterium]